ncbi:hypothetical protein BH23PLA1_BH23PLA1_29400 [soil metagenome]
MADDHSEVLDLFENNDPSDHPIPALKLILELNNGNGRWRTISPSRNIRKARGRHIFVVQRGQLIVGKVAERLGAERPISHIDLVGGDPIAFGGEIKFGGSYGGRGRIRWWNDQTGHYFKQDRLIDPTIVPSLPQELFERYRRGT